MSSDRKLGENVSKESPDDYWTVMETLTAFVRERSQRNEAERLSQDAKQRIERRAYLMWLNSGQPGGSDQFFWDQAVRLDQLGDMPATDIAAVLAVIRRRSEQNRARERANNWHLDLNSAVLKRADFSGWARTNYSNLVLTRFSDLTNHLSIAHLEGANLRNAHLEGAFLMGARLQGADLGGAHLTSAVLAGAQLQGAILYRANLEGVNFGPNYFGISVGGAHLEGAGLSGARGVTTYQISGAHGDAQTSLPDGVDPPDHWPRLLWR